MPLKVEKFSDARFTTLNIKRAGGHLRLADLAEVALDAVGVVVVRAHQVAELVREDLGGAVALERVVLLGGTEVLAHGECRVVEADAADAVGQPGHGGVAAGLDVLVGEHVDEVSPSGRLPPKRAFAWLMSPWASSPVKLTVS